MVEPKAEKTRPAARPGLVAKRKTPIRAKAKAIKGVAKPAATGRTRARMPEAMKSSMLHIRLDETLKDDVTRTLEKIGISMPEAIRVFLKRIVKEQAFPFRLEVPNAETAAALRDSIASTDRKRYATAEGMFDDLEKRIVP